MFLRQGEIFLKKYEVRQTLAKGKNWQTCKIVEILTDRVFVLKIFYGKWDVKEEMRFRKILSHAKLINSEKISKIIEYEMGEDFAYWIEEWIDGVPLTHLSEAGGSGKKFSPEELEPLILPLAEAIDDVHKNFPHFLLHSENIFVLPDNVKISDAGKAIAFDFDRLMEMEDEKGERRVFFSPEFLRRESRVSASSDIYSLGSIIYELLTGKKPVPPQILPPSELNEDLTVDVDEFVLRCLSEDPARRIQSTAEFVEGLGSILGKQLKGGSLPKVFDLEEMLKEEEETEEEDITRVFEEIEEEKAKTVEVEKYEEPEAFPAKPRRTFLPFIFIFFFVSFAGGSYIFFRFFQSPGREIKKPAPGETKVSFEQTITFPPVLTGEVEKEVKGMEEKVEEKEVEGKRAEGEKAESPKLSPPPVSTASVPETKKTVIRVPPIKRKEPPCPSDMIFIQEGDTYVGSSDDDEMKDPTDLPYEKRHIKSFCIDIYEYPNKKGERPLVRVNWHEAKEMCEKEGKRLCREEEWERACKGNRNLRYPYGNEWDGKLCVTEDSQGRDRNIYFSGVAVKCQSDFGVFDMSGNVAEWVDDAFEKGSEDKVVKGGSFKRPDYAVRCASRKNMSPGQRNEETGFRCCKDPHE